MRKMETEVYLVCNVSLHCTCYLQMYICFLLFGLTSQKPTVN